MIKNTLVTLFLLSFAFAQNNTAMIHAHSIDISYTSADGKIKKVTIARDSDLRCREIPFNAREYWDGSYASRDVADYCKKTFITTAGKLSPMKMHKDIETFGELEVLEFIEDMQDDKQMLFVDSRRTQWFESLTIPSAINIPFIYFTERDKWTKEKKEALKRFGVKGGNRRSRLFYGCVAPKVWRHQKHAILLPRSPAPEKLSGRVVAHRGAERLSGEISPWRWIDYGRPDVSAGH